MGDAANGKRDNGRIFTTECNTAPLVCVSRRSPAHLSLQDGSHRGAGQVASKPTESSCSVSLEEVGMNRLTVLCGMVAFSGLLQVGCMQPCDDLTRNDAVRLNVLKNRHLRLFAVTACAEQGDTQITGTARTYHRGGPRPCGRVHAEVVDASGQVAFRRAAKLEPQTLSPRLGYRSRFQIRFPGQVPPGSTIRVWYGS